MTPDLSVIIPVGGVDDDLPLQLDALMGQDFTGTWELVLSLNSPDPADRRSLETLVADRIGDAGPPARIVDSSDVRSASHARNIGAGAAVGHLLLFCDGDDIADEAWMSSLVAALDDFDAVGGHLDEELLAIPGQEDWRPSATPGELPSFLEHPYLVSANMGVSREAFTEVGGFDTGLIRGEDIAFSWDLVERGRTLGYCADAIMHYRHRRGVWPMMRQHYLYGRGFSQILARRGTPGDEGGSGLGALKPNGQSVDRLTPIYFLRRGSIAAGRIAGLVEERLLERRSNTLAPSE